MNDSSNTIPECPHGPMLLFPKYGKNKAVVSRVFACSAYRSSKECPFSMREDSKMSSEKEMMLEDMKKTSLPQLDIGALKNRLKRVKKMPPSKRKYCNSCNELVTSLVAHESHDVVSGISNEMLQTPTKILQQKSDSKKESQFHFTDDTTNTILDIISHNQRSHVICVGTPSVHEAIKSSNSKAESILLDIDHRYYNFYSEEEFIWFNMYNGYFFQNENSPMNLFKFFKDKDVMLIVDPPFGAKFEPLADTVKKLERMHLEACDSLKSFDVMLFSPYFREKEILNVFPMYHMADYKVNYANHKQFQSGGRKQGSPVRIYTSLASDKVPLPTLENYWFCKRCKAWRSEDNSHCDKCNTCSSKNGTKYWHCDKCRQCIKPSWYHCDTCSKCCHPSHVEEHKAQGDKKPIATKRRGPLLKMNKKTKKRKFK
uniref:Zinc finger CCHC domain-containing protein 4 n=1 Tax=Cacopsylla melanoneura TaxID=428564 RepID=A0A8D8M5C0_9HEMI